MPKMTGMDQNFHCDKKFKLTPNAQFCHKNAWNTRNTHTLSFLNVQYSWLITGTQKNDQIPEDFQPAQNAQVDNEAFLTAF